MYDNIDIVDSIVLLGIFDSHIFPVCQTEDLTYFSFSHVPLLLY